MYTFGGSPADVLTDEAGNVVPDYPVQVAVASTGEVVTALFEIDGTTPISELRSNNAASSTPGAIRAFKCAPREIEYRYNDPSSTLVKWYESGREVATTALDQSTSALADAATAAAAAAAASAAAATVSSSLATLTTSVTDVIDTATDKVKTPALPDVAAAPYIRQRQGEWWVDREASVRSISMSNVAAVINAILADAAFADGDRIVLRPGSYASTSSINLDTPCHFIGTGATITTAGGIKQFNVTSSDVTIEGVKLVGPGASFVSGSYGIYAQAASYAAAYQRLTVKNVEISNCAYVSIWIKYANDFRVEGCNLHDQTYAGVHVQSGVRGWITRNRVENVTRTGVSGSGNGYNITVTRVQSNDLTADPHSAYVSVTDNLVTTNPNWEGIDTHGGRNITIAGNRILGCLYGINVVDCPDGAGDAWSDGAPLNVVVVNNVIWSGTTTGYGSGIRFGGAYNTTSATTVQYATGIIAGNVVKDYGNDVTTSSAFGGIYIGSTRGVVVANNEIESPTVMGIRLNLNNDGYLIVGNTFTEPWAQTGDTSSCVNNAGNNNVGSIVGNIHKISGAHSGAAHKNEAFMRSSSGVTGGQTFFCGNQWETTAAFANVAQAGLRLGFYSTTPIAKPTGTPANATDLATALTLVNSLKTNLIALGLIA